MKRNPVFQGNNAMLGLMKSASYHLENNNYVQLLTADVGITSGRIYNSRNADERIEYAFKDITSMFFYLLAAPLLNKKFAEKFDEKLGINTMLRPKITSILNDKLVEEVESLYQQKNSNTLSIQEIKEHLFASRAQNNNNLHLYNNQLIASNKLSRLSNMALERYNKSNKENFKNLSEYLAKLSESLYTGTYNGEVFDNKLLTQELKKLEYITADKKLTNIANIATKVLENMPNVSDKLKQKAPDLAKEGFLGDPKFLMEAFKSEYKNIQYLNKFIPGEKLADIKKQLKEYSDRFIAQLEQLSNKDNLTRDEINSVLAKTKKLNIAMRGCTQPQV
ncbi:MAG: hypothetical protein MZU95_04470 [Desulfomicrobium escambiense]|nr:hypothetical protein [Desulfomicrobium escambiense]